MNAQSTEFKSGASFLGLPLVHFCFARRTAGGAVSHGVARGWIAVGAVAHGVLVGVGGVATGALALGGASFGLLAVGGGALGLIGLGGVSLGGWALGGLAAGYFAMGGLAVGWKAALGGAAIAREFAVGGLALAEHAGDGAAKQFFASAPFFKVGGEIAQHSRWALLLLLLPVILPWMRRGTRDEIISGKAPGPS